MNEEKAREILKDYIVERYGEAGHLYSESPYMSWRPGAYASDIILDGDFTPMQLKAIAWWVENKGE